MQVERVPQSLAAVQLKWSRTLYAVAVVALLAIPVQYRGGADLPHAHALYQLWIPGGYGLVHHHPHVGERVLSMNLSGEANGPPDVVGTRADADGPALAAMTTLAEKSASLAVTVAAALLLLLDRPAVSGQRACRLVGFTWRPADPPPRWADSYS
ncbi:MAG: hypothetical protein M3R02_30375 [Chloroflexota bacterium]|nr:hypothetical protein [Chloroflexota bacterium]